MKYQVYYMHPKFFRYGIMGMSFLQERGLVPAVDKLDRTHIHLGEFEATDLDALFTKMQGEVWSPKGEARPLIEQKGLRHTSMSVGDVAVTPGGHAWICDTFGWKELGHQDDGDWAEALK